MTCFWLLNLPEEEHVLMELPWYDQSSHPVKSFAIWEPVIEFCWRGLGRETLCTSVSDWGFAWLIESILHFRVSSNLHFLQCSDVIHRHRTPVFPDKYLIYKDRLQQDSGRVGHQKSRLPAFCEKVVGFFYFLPQKVLAEMYCQDALQELSDCKGGWPIRSGSSGKFLLTEDKWKTTVSKKNEKYGNHFC